MSDLINWASNNLDVVSPLAIAAYEVFARIKPTAKDWSIVNLIKKIVDLIPNKTSDGAKH